MNLDPVAADDGFWLAAAHRLFHAPPMPAYLIARVQVTDWERYRQYTRLTPGAIAKFDGRFIVRGGETLTLEGPQETGRVVVIEFPTFEQAKAFYNSEDYAQARKLREGAATGQFILVDGVASQ